MSLIRLSRSTICRVLDSDAWFTLMVFITAASICIAYAVETKPFLLFAAIMSLLALLWSYYLITTSWIEDIKDGNEEKQG
ncbi:hypothetical protein [Achromobacter phage Motura]|uniref:Uncharacterized protein n=1 Tax=Achromobacter phage Motura TaxID=2591403 RepID=A0A514CSU1_9CAUD|nr:hypothetical protein H1O15_gp254 [Achromobacter phage Motura]QDH83534.1 hypothetical protein [Achromobacter phage Motura]